MMVISNSGHRLNSELNCGWWRNKPRKVLVLNDTEGWATPWCHELARRVFLVGDDCKVIKDPETISAGDVAFFLGCTKIVPQDLLLLNRHNLVVHASPLPLGRGFSPLKWQICEGKNEIPVTLFEADAGCDSGPVYSQRVLGFDGHELLREMQEKLGELMIQMCLQWLSSPSLPLSRAQVGEGTKYGRRTEEHQRLDPHKTLAQQLSILRTVDNDRYPAFFDLGGYRYELRITKSGRVEEK